MQRLLIHRYAAYDEIIEKTNSHEHPNKLKVLQSKQKTEVINKNTLNNIVSIATVFLNGVNSYRERASASFSDNLETVSSGATVHCLMSVRNGLTYNFFHSA
ncbi:MAG: hypothetical protein ACXVCN_12540 [Bdellovibrio sp.]